ncbi:MAG: SpoIID/LytB domain-containing protein [Muribaculaceae bacterium]|nr:SpoIID/LytB domain-containing protein [Muribaculaceae bacterium]
MNRRKGPYRLENGNLINFIKLLAILAGMAFLFWLWLHRVGTEQELQEPEGEKISMEDVHILLQALDLEIDLETAKTEETKQPQQEGQSLEEQAQKENTEQTNLTYEQYRRLYEAVGGTEKNMPDFAGKYEDFHAFLKEDWYQAYRTLLAYYDTESSIWKTTVFILKVDTQEKKLYTQDKEYLYCSSSFQDSAFSKEEVYVKSDELLTSIRVLDERTILENVWVMEVSGEQDPFVMECFYHQINFTVEAQKAALREQVADLTFRGGKLEKAQGKQDKIRGKLLSVSEDSIEIEGYGAYQTEKTLEVYKLYGTLETQKKSDLMIGYDYTDFVIKDNKICACLVSREGEIDQIRVLLKNTAKGDYYYEEAVVIVDGNRTVVKADKLREGERVSFQSKALTDRVKLEVEGDTREDNLYRGTLEFYKTTKGMVLINELPLEEYLYAVVPSEMPASYPMEALKAQAVCARTYAFRHILHAGLADFGAHLDNTTSYQVYHNIKENAATTTAVKETSGMMLYYQGELADNYYYSTSCGYGTDTRIWKSESGEALPYMRAGKLAPKDAAAEALSGEDMAKEENFAAFITQVDETDFESGEPWYRWRYEVPKLDTDGLLARLKERYQANESLVLTRKGKQGDYYYVSEPVKDIGKLKDISISKRGEGGIADEMILTGSKAVIKVISEYNIRRVLCDGNSNVIRQDKSEIAAKTLLPSAFFIIEAGKEDGYMVGYTLIGGGYGHGVGMSQNGAKEMGSLGYDYQEILKSFFTDCEVDS